MEQRATKRKKTPDPTEAEVLTRSARRCCLCYGLNRDFQEKAGQIAHLDRNPRNDKLENLAWLCLPHHDQYDSRTSQSKNTTPSEAKKYRTQLYEAVQQWRNGILFPDWRVAADAPLLEFDGEIPPSDSIPSTGIRFCDKDRTGSGGPSMLCLSAHFKTSRYFGRNLPPANERWLFFRADMRPAFTVTVQVCALNQRDIDELMGFLTGYQGKYFPEWLHGAGEEFVKQFLEREERGWSLHGPRPDKMEMGAGDYFRIWRENDVVKLVISTYTPTNAGVSINARFSDEAMKAFADYLEATGFTKPLRGG
jgi:hypothetical protein